MTSSFGMGSHQATLEEDVTLLNGQTSSSLTGRTSGLPQGQLLGGSFIFNIFFIFSLCFQQLIGRFHFPFIFNKLAETNCTIKFFWCGVILKECGGIGVTSAGVTVLRRAFIALLAYTYWLEKSRDKVSFASSDALGLTYEFPSGSHTQGGWSLRRPANGESLRYRHRWRRLSVDAVRCRLFQSELPKIEARTGWNHADLL